MVRATFWHRKTNMSCVASVRIKSGGRQPAVVRATFWHRKTNASCVVSVRIKSGGRQPTVGGKMRIGRHERRSSADRRRCVWTAVAVAGIGATGLT